MVLAELGGKLRGALRKLQTGSGNTNLGEEDVKNVVSEITRALIEADVNVKLVMQLRENILEKVSALLEKITEPNQRTNAQLSKLVQRTVIDELTNLLQTKNKPYNFRHGKSNVVLFVGLQGAGKTTTIAKFAKYYQRKSWKVALVCADTFRAGALDQLKQNATKLRIPFYGSYTESDPVQIATDGVQSFKKSKYEMILVDTSGRHKQEQSLLEEMQYIEHAVNPDTTILVMDATQGQAVFDQAKAFHESTRIGSVIITKLDGHAKGGGALSAVAATQSPILFTGSGEHFDDLDIFHANSFVSKLLGFGDVRGLMEAMKGDEKQDELMEKMSKGEFTLRDMYNQFEKILNMGPLNKLAGMIPGMPEYLVPKGGDQESTNRLRKFMVMMDSMTKAELDGKVDMKTDPSAESRIRRIAAGSGSHPNEVKMLLLAHKQFEGMVGKMGKSGMIGKGAQAKQQQMAAQMRKNPALIQQRLNQMDPKMLQQMGGRDKVMAMMQQMAKGGGGPGGPGAGGMPDMGAAMQAMMGGGGGGMPPGGMPPGGMNAAMQAMMGGGGGGGMPPMPDMGGGGGMPPGLGGMDMESMMKMAQSMGMGGMPPGQR